MSAIGVRVATSHADSVPLAMIAATRLPSTDAARWVALLPASIFGGSFPVAVTMSMVVAMTVRSDAGS